MAQSFLPCDRDQDLLLPPSLREWLSEDHLAWFVLDAVAELNLEQFYSSIAATAGVLRRMILIDGKHILLPSDAGVPAITAALNYLDTTGRTANYPELLGLPHHGSRHNLDRATIARILGPHRSGRYGTAVASVAKESPRPSPRVANAAGRRGYPVYTNRDGTLWHHSGDAPPRNWGLAEPIPPLDEDDHD